MLQLGSSSERVVYQRDVNSVDLRSPRLVFDGW